MMKNLNKNIKISLIKDKKSTFKKNLFKTANILKDWKMWALFPLTFLHQFNGVFVVTDMPKSFILCMKGIEYVGYWLCLLGLSAALFSYIIGYISKFTGRILIIMLFIFLSFFLNFYLLFSSLNDYLTLKLVVIALIYGAIDAINNTQFYGNFY